MVDRGGGKRWREEEVGRRWKERPTFDDDLVLADAKVNLNLGEVGRNSSNVSTFLADNKPVDIEIAQTLAPFLPIITLQTSK